MTVRTPEEILDQMRQRWLTEAATFDEDMLTEDVVIETPFALPGRPTRFEGREKFLAYARAGRAELPVRFDDCRNVVVHHTTDPATIVVEYELVGTLTSTGVTASAPFIGVLRARDGRIAHWREYQHTYAIMQALGQL